MQVYKIVYIRLFHTTFVGSMMLEVLCMVYVLYLEALGVDDGLHA
jgi:hypothetical protein